MFYRHITKQTARIMATPSILINPEISYIRLVTPSNDILSEEQNGFRKADPAVIIISQSRR